jgi:SAM-dependent methyltransferase
VAEKWTEDPRLVVTYDVECAGRLDHDFYLDRIRMLDARSIVDLGCGTGVFATAAAGLGIDVIGVDPALVMIDACRARDPLGRVTWLLGDASVLPTGCADLAVMMGHVAQYFVNDDEWRQTLRHCHRALRSGGHLTFESRNPAARAWEQWTKQASSVRLGHPDGGWFESWAEVVELTGDPRAPTETHEGHTLLPTGEHVVARETLRFRGLEEISSSLAASDFQIVSVLGDWDGAALQRDSPEFIVLAARMGAAGCRDG